jgi:chemotaxis methyl-accepting protein methylase
MNDIYSKTKQNVLWIKIKNFIKKFIPENVMEYKRVFYKKFVYTFRDKYVYPIINKFMYQHSRHGYHQIDNFTKPNRYPEIFRYVSSLLQGNREMKILSFGCSVGLECFSLREYFKTTTIIGYDINQKNITVAKANNIDPLILFFSDWTDVCKKEYYDAVFAMTVLCRNPELNI